MKVIYDKHAKVYGVKIEEPEDIIVINTTDITEAREEFIKQMTLLFNDAVCKQLEYNWENLK